MAAGLVHHVVIEHGAGVHFEAEVNRVLGGHGVDEDLDGIVEVSRIVVFGVESDDIDVFALVRDIEVVVVPEEAGNRLLFGAGLSFPWKNQLDFVRAAQALSSGLPSITMGEVARFTS